MSSLREVQAACRQAFTGGAATGLLAMVRGNGVASEERIAVYRNNHREIYRKALAASFPVIERLVGETCLAGLARAYTHRHPSRSGDLQDFGAGFPAFLERTYGSTRFRYLASVADLEWALEEVHLEPDEPPLTIRALRTFSPDDYGNLTFTVRRAVRLLRSPFPALSIWRANQPGNSARVDLDEGGQDVAVARRGDDLQMHLLDRNTFALASELARGARLADGWPTDAGAAETGERRARSSQTRAAETGKRRARSTQTGVPEAGQRRARPMHAGAPEAGQRARSSRTRPHESAAPDAARDLAAALQTILKLGLFARVSVADPQPAAS